MRRNSYHLKDLNLFRKQAKEIIERQSYYHGMDGKDFACRTDSFRIDIAHGKPLDTLLIDAYALVREASTRILGLEAYEEQLMGAIALHQGMIAEMMTGEGKTLTALFPAYLNALSGKGVFIVTANDYLARRDYEQMLPVFTLLGLKTGYIYPGITLSEKQQAYSCDITYGMNQEFGFDYLKDNTAKSALLQSQRGFHYAIIDEADSVLIDDANTPLILSAASPKRSNHFYSPESRARSFILSLTDEDYECDEANHEVYLTEEGVEKAEQFYDLENLVDPKHLSIYHHLMNALQAHFIQKIDRDYIVEDDCVLIVDRNTGRKMHGRRFSDGLHEAIETKEGIEVKNPNRTLASTTIRSFYKLFDKLSGMTGTALSSEDEFYEIYGLKIAPIPTHKPNIRIDHPDRVFSTEKLKYGAILKKIYQTNKTGQPILVGTGSIEESEKLSAALRHLKIKHSVLNAKELAKEAEIIAAAGKKGSVTISTNMAGRGTDIRLGEGVDQLGGLYVIGTQRFHSVRIDDQLRGRSARQGDPGETELYLSLEDTILEQFPNKSLLSYLSRYDGQSVEIKDNRTRKIFERAQNYLEGQSFQSRKNRVTYDEMVHRRRTKIYNDRQMLLEHDDCHAYMIKILQDTASYLIEDYSNKDFEQMRKNLEDELNRNYFDRHPISLSETLDTTEKLQGAIEQLFLGDLNRMTEILGYEQMHLLEKRKLLSEVDRQWQLIQDEIERIRGAIHLRNIGQTNPLYAFVAESSEVFSMLQRQFELETAKHIIDSVYIDPKYADLELKQ